ncbi:DNA-processing protein DprA [Lysinibacillus parviboronicapiens]|uniref:DNA-processing protein DprA n=1 Tax=Lysinibacillus parviboronicapiens TaxID=436516 RepID=UPI000D36B31F|nr:DNA-processing protein DprA [Lysinibacillus parviboronicapiens]
MKKQLIFILYDLGISLSALSDLYRVVDEHIIERVLEGDYLELQFEKQLFSEKDLKLLDSLDAINNSRRKIESIIEGFKQDKIEYFVYYEEEYPDLLRKIPSPPFFLFMKGNRQLLNDKFICSIVGTRTPSPQTVTEIDRFVAEMVDHDIVTASGLALGTDIQVHLSTLGRNGKTIAILPGPITSIIPKTHTKHALEILQNQGLLISEYYLDEPNKKTNYVNRNRIISGISNAVIIAECQASSGTMHTARFAYVQRKPLYCFDNKSSGVLKILHSNSAEIYRGVCSLK